MHYPVIIFITFASIEEANNILKALISKQLIACAQKGEVDSMYIWEKKVESSREVQVKITTFSDFVSRVEAEVARGHSYDTFQFLVTKVEYTNKKYLKWMEEIVSMKNEEL